MENNIPVPTDNSFKFYALFGLLLLVFSIGASLYQTEANNAFFVKSYLDLEALKEFEAPSHLEETKIALIQRQIDVRKSDKQFINCALGIPLLAGICGICYGFIKWHKEVQPMLDEMARVQLDLAKLELKKKKAEWCAASRARDGAGETKAAEGTKD